ncbi:hypothetical protein QE152_g11138 [Popillia japonica]|uniref:Uncharacterized protein n=1 Tax=Popillia japonica TaxID=7064 RepID=A0AAW1LSA6_POPJA
MLKHFQWKKVIEWKTKVKEKEKDDCRIKNVEAFSRNSWCIQKQIVRRQVKEKEKDDCRIKNVEAFSRNSWCIQKQIVRRQIRKEKLKKKMEKGYAERLIKEEGDWMENRYKKMEVI